MAGLGESLYAFATLGNLADLGTGQALHHPSDEIPRIATPQEVAGQLGRRTVGRRALEGRQPASSGRERAVKLGSFLERRFHGRAREIPGNALGRELLTQPPTTDVSPRGSRLGPPPRERLVIQIAARGQIGDDSLRDI